MTDYEIKCIISKELKNIQDGAFQTALRHILFDGDNVINWKKAYKVITEMMPEIIKSETKIEGIGKYSGNWTIIE